MDLINNKHTKHFFSFFIFFGKCMFFAEAFTLIIRGIELYYFKEILHYTFNTEAILGFGIYHDFLTNAFMVLPWCILVYVIKLFSEKTFFVVHFLGSMAFMTLHLCLFAFFSKTKYLFGAEWSTYSIYEMTKTANASTTAFEYIRLGTLLVSFAFLIYYVLKIKIESKYIKTGLFVLGLTSVIFLPNNLGHMVKTKEFKWFTSINDFFFGQSKIAFFLSSNYKMESTDVQLETSFFCYKKCPKNSNLHEYFHIKKSKPNVVIILVESLTSAFSGKRNYLGSYTPFLDSLSNHSLLWYNNLSGAERTYGVLPNVLSSAVYGGTSGFIHNPQHSAKHYPKHSSLVSELMANGYKTNFYYGGDAVFDNTDLYTKHLGFSKVIDAKYFKAIHTPEKHLYAWGYTDSLLFNEALKSKKEPFLDVVLTLGIHTPFDQFDPLTKKNTGAVSDFMAGAIFRADRHLKEYFEKVKTQKGYENTIFIITGDHHTAEITPKTPIEAFHTPMIFFSPMLSKTAEFPSIVSHRDVAPTLYALLSEYGLQFPDALSFLGKQLNTSTTFETNYTMPLCLYHKDQYANLLQGKYYLKGDEVFEISDSIFNSKKVTNPLILKRLLDTKRKLISQDLGAIEYGLLP